jgi:hypothetical protein
MQGRMGALFLLSGYSQVGQLDDGRERRGRGHPSASIPLLSHSSRALIAATPVAGLCLE